MNTPRSLLALCLAAMFGAVSLQAQVNLSSLTPVDNTYTYTQNFDTLPVATATGVTAEALALGTLNAALPGWISSLGPSSSLGSPSTTEAAYAGLSGTGVQSSATIPSVRNYGLASGSDRALGLYVATSSNFANGALGLVFQNTTGVAMGSVTIGYTGEMWRRGTTGQLDFAYNAMSSLDSFNLRTTPGWIDVNSLDFHSPYLGSGAGVDGNGTSSVPNGGSYWDGSNYVTSSGTTVVNNYTIFAPITINLSTPLAAGDYFVLRWNNSQTIAGMGIDNLSVTFAAIPEPSTYAALFGVLALGAVAAIRRRGQR